VKYVNVDLSRVMLLRHLPPAILGISSDSPK